MMKQGAALQLSASDLVGHLNCRHLTDLDFAAAHGRLERPHYHDPLLEILVERGERHEKDYLSHLASLGHDIVRIAGKGITQTQAEQTIAAMRAGARVIAQATFLQGTWGGRADVLLRVDTPSKLGAWSYEPIDTKLARETKGGTVLQLSLYAELLAQVQGVMPEHMHVVVPGSGFEPQTYRTAAYAAYYRYVKQRLEQSIARQGRDATYPDPKDHCEICRWRVKCETRRRGDDHLCLVAGISAMQIGELARHEVDTTAKLARVPLPLPWKPDRGAKQSYERTREQARVQVQGRETNTPVYETLAPAPGVGLCKLPAPSPGDIFFDLEGDPFVADAGLEYLFGYVTAERDGKPAYVCEWAFTRDDEARAFKRFVDLVVERWQRFPDMHVYHYAPYEPAALKRLMGRYATREDEIDRMLRGSLFVDLYSIVRQGVRASVESYSIKKLEVFYGYERPVDLADARAALARMQGCLELDDHAGITGEVKRVIADYNRDDCVSALRLREWLEGIRTGLIARGAQIPRPEAQAAAPSERIDERQRKVWEAVERLTFDVPVDASARTPEQQARWVLAHTLDWHRREQKSVWWEFYRLADLPAEDLLDERHALSGLTFVEHVGGTARAPVHRYAFPPQEVELRGDESLHTFGGEKFGTLEAISSEGRTVDIKKRQDTAGTHAEAVFAHDSVNSDVMADALLRIGNYASKHGMESGTSYRAARDVLMRRAPKVHGAGSTPDEWALDYVPPRARNAARGKGAPSAASDAATGGDATLRNSGETPVQAAVRIGPMLDGGVLAIQGPPGAGKTFTAARMICALVKAKKKVGITANSHKVIRNLLNEVVKAADEERLDVRCIQKISEDHTETDVQGIAFSKSNEEVLAAIAAGASGIGGGGKHVAAGTAWLWSRQDAFESLDVLFVDEAAQMSLANVLAVSQACRSLVLLGDPQQLEQPMKGSHPEGTDVSALDHILAGKPTIGDKEGLFLEETWRLHPRICAFTSELFYESRLHSRAGLERLAVKSRGAVNGSGMRYLPVEHEGNQSSSPEEAERIRELVQDILDAPSTWIDRDGAEKPVTLDDILIIAPYNAQVFELQERLPGARIGTVDKFQGQEAAIVIYSMTTSSHADAPRGMDFLYSLNRLNVATSRAKCVCVLVASPAVFEPECRTPEQMRMANAFCRYLEMASALSANRRQPPPAAGQEQAAGGQLDLAL